MALPYPSTPDGPDTREAARGAAAPLDTVLTALRAALGTEVQPDVPVRAQGASSFHAVLVASELEETHGIVLDYANLLEQTPTEIAGALLPAS